MLNAATIHFAAVTDRGAVRSENQDRWYADPELGLFVVADGLGGHMAGGLAAQLVVDILPRLVRRALSATANAPAQERRLAIAEQVKLLSDLVYKETRGQPGVHGTGTTLVLALIDADQAMIVHAGDSRVYLRCAGQLRQLTQDHTLGRLLVMTHEVSEAAVGQHPAARRLTRYVGMPAAFTADSQTIEFAAGDCLLLCSDGLHGQVHDGEISRIVCSGTTIEEKARDLVSASNRAGGCDNVTVLLVSRTE